jgi:hypothetical protein
MAEEIKTFDDAKIAELENAVRVSVKNKTSPLENLDWRNDQETINQIVRHVVEDICARSPFEDFYWACVFVGALLNGKVAVSHVHTLKHGEEDDILQLQRSFELRIAYPADGDEGTGKLGEGTDEPLTHPPDRRPSQQIPLNEDVIRIMRTTKAA